MTPSESNLAATPAGLVLGNHAYYATPPDAYAAERCRLDFWRPASTGYPTLVYLHGGGLFEGSRGEGLDFARRMTAEGLGVALVDYRLSPRATCPAYLEDSAAAVAWVLDHAAELGADPRRVFLTGHSAGGYLAAMIALDARHLAKFNYSNLDLAGCIPISGQMLTHFTVRVERGLPREQLNADEWSPIYYSAAKGPAMLCIAGGDDIPARAEENALLVASRRAAGVRTAELLIVPGRTHSSIKEHWLRQEDEVATAVLSFIQRTA